MDQCESVVPAVGSEEHILQCVRGAVGGGDEAEEEEDEVGHTEQLSQLLVYDLFPERHLLLRVPPEPVPADDVLQERTKQSSLKTKVVPLYTPTTKPHTQYYFQLLQRHFVQDNSHDDTHFPPILKNAVEIFFIDFACVVIKADEKGEKKNK